MVELEHTEFDPDHSSVGSNPFSRKMTGLQLVKETAYTAQHQKRVRRDDDDSSDEDDDSKQREGGQEIAVGDQGAFFAQDAARTANCTGYIVLLSLLIIGGMLAIVTYFFFQGMEEEDYKDAYKVVAAEVARSVQRNIGATVHSLENIAGLFTALADEGLGTPPQLTVANFEPFAFQARETTGAVLLAYAPWLSSDRERNRWGDYSAENLGWISRGFASTRERADASVEPSIRPFVWNHTSRNSAFGQDQGSYQKDLGPGPYAPAWQMSPPPLAPLTIVNFNLATHPTYRRLATLSTETKLPYLEPVVLNELYGAAAVSINSAAAGEEPSCVFILPVMDTLTPDQPREVIGHISAGVPWSRFFRNILQSDQEGITVVLESCGTTNTFQLRGGTVEFMGVGDLHDDDYSDMVNSTIIMVTELGGNVGCRHTINIYPTEVYESSFETDTPLRYSMVIVGLILFATTLFFIYDCVVRRQQVKVLGEAERSSAIVASLFPGQVARRLFVDASHHSSGGAAGDASALDRSSHSANMLSFMNKEEKVAEASRPIAELFPEATVMFADISGFTAWSSIREPSQVFLLLESIFQSFDALAKKYEVFKVETVGDCYVAVCGLPEANPDHAVVMAQFSRECLRKFLGVVLDLELKLGPDTSDLAMRFGLNSGPVTAGVLRGERARFQLFGDTVNTAARMESTGARNQVHISEQTASLIMEAGRKDWVKPRDDVVKAKGKGLLKTFWLELDVRPRLWHENSGIQASEDDAIPLAELAGETDDLGSFVSSLNDKSGHKGRKQARLVDWNTELLLQLLKQVVARRFALGGRRTHQQQTLNQMAKQYGRNTLPVDEVVEIIVLPDYTQTKMSHVDPETIVLSPGVREQCRTYVSMIASMYRDNPFHNFEHASHVTMSVSKLLSRIVAPEIDWEQVGDKVREDHLLHDHTYGITSDPLTQFAVVLSALIHDVDHRGVSNFTLAEEDQHLAEAYENKSIAEQNSVDLAWNALMTPDFEELRSCIFSDVHELKRFRELLVNSVIATDIFDKELSQLRKNRWAKAFAETFSGKSKEDKNRRATIVIEHLIQASDVAHTMQHWHVYQKWNERLFQEMFAAYKSGRTKKDPTVGWFKGEIGFYDNYIIPLAKKLKNCGVFGVASDEYLNYATENRREWATKGEELVDRLLDKYANGHKNMDLLRSGEFRLPGAMESSSEIL